MGHSNGRGAAAHGVLALLLATTSLSAFVTERASAQPAAATANTIDYAIPAQSLSTALVEFARQSHLQVLFNQDEIAHLTSRPLHGRYDADTALAQLLPSNAPSIRISDDQIVLVNNARPQGGDTEAPTSEEVVVTGTRLRGDTSTSPVTTIDRAQIEQSGAQTVTQLMRTLPQNFGGGPNEATRTGDGANNLLEGSSINLRGLGADATLILINGRRVGSGGTSNALYVDVSSIPLSAIERVEVLTDGASAIYGSDAIGGVVNFILRDNFTGAETTARYGAAYDGAAAETAFSQALGGANARGHLFGVYDYYHRDPLDNSDRRFAANSDLTSLGGSRFSSAASNPATVVSPVVAAVTPGQDGTGLTTDDFIIGQRNFQNFNLGQQILGEQERHSLYLSAGWDVTDRLNLFAEARGADRSFDRDRAAATSTNVVVPASHPNFVALTPGATLMRLQYSFFDDLGPTIESGDVQSRALVAGGTLAIGNTWRAELTGSWDLEDGKSRLDNTVNGARLNEALGNTNADPNFNPAIDGYFNPLGDGSHSPANVIDYIRGSAVTHYASRMTAFDAQANGTLFSLPAGDVQLAIGGEYREESFGTNSLEFTSALAPVARSSPTLSRIVRATFAEARVPLVSPDMNVALIHGLDLSLAARHEDTTNGGADTTPKIGLIWRPAEGLAVRAAWGKSFKSPALTDTIPASQSAFIFDLPDSTAPGGTSTTLILQGTNPDLTSEHATTWTTGFTLRPPSSPGFVLDFNLFRIVYRDQIATPDNPFVALTQSDFFAPIITRNPDPAAVQAVIDSPFFIPIGPTPPASDVTAIIDARLRNLSRSIVEGFDTTVSQDFHVGDNQFRLSLAATYMLHDEQSFTDTTPLTDVVDTAGNPVDLRARLGLTWRRDGWSAGTFVNYVNGYADLSSNPRRHVDTSTTVDASLGFDFDAPGLAHGVSARLSVRNLFNADPPFYNNPIGVGYDPENADPIGRFVSLQLTKTW